MPEGMLGERAGLLGLGCDDLGRLSCHASRRIGEVGLFSRIALRRLLRNDDPWRIVIWVRFGIWVG